MTAVLLLAELPVVLQLVLDLHVLYKTKRQSRTAPLRSTRPPAILNQVVLELCNVKWILVAIPR